MQHLRITSPANLTDEVVAVFTGDPAVSPPRPKMAARTTSWSTTTQQPEGLPR